MLPSGHPQKETPPEGGVGPEMLSPAGLVEQSIDGAEIPVKSNEPGGRPQSLQRVMAYLDRFNFYFGLKYPGFKRYYWLDVASLARSLLKPGQTLTATNYLTARIRSNGRDSADQKRQNNYLEALDLQSVRCQFGHYLQKTRRCRQCGATLARLRREDG